MNVLLVGSGGREHALAWALARSPATGRLICAPGNGGMQEIGECVRVPATAVAALVELARREQVSVVVVGPEAPLAAGLVDALEAEGIPAFGPCARAARLESSKAYAKRIMRKYGIPTADGRIFEDPQTALAFLQEAHYPLVLKADGLAAGKGVVICPERPDAEAAVQDIMVSRRHGQAGAALLVEELLEGEELSLMAITDGETVLTLPPARDYKRALAGDRGPNTGGMGAYCPSPHVDDALEARIVREVIVPVVHAMHREGHPFRGVLYAGLMLTAAGPKVLEFNARLGDPETQAVLARLHSDLLDIVVATCERRLGEVEATWDPRPAVCVVLTSRGYPGGYEQGHPIEGLEAAAALPDVRLFHAGTRREGERLLTSGGRVLGVTALGDDRAAARQRAYQACDLVRFEGLTLRRDIAD